jgi:hypothetical protein
VLKLRVLALFALVLIVVGCSTPETSATGDTASSTQPSAAPASAKKNRNTKREGKIVHVFVALCDNDSQGIVPVPARIGNGNDPANNLYWGCAEGVKAYFSRSRQWKLISAQNNPSETILERCVFQHRESNAFIIADAYRGSNIKDATADFLASASGNKEESIEVTSSNKRIELAIAGSADLVSYVGHNGLMDFSLPFPDKAEGAGAKDAIVLCCISERYFWPALRKSGARPLLMTTQLMYPGAFILKAALDGWLAGERAQEIRERAAKAYADNQRISVKAARGVFAPPPSA